MHKLFGRKDKKKEKEVKTGGDKHGRKYSTGTVSPTHNITVYGADKLQHNSSATSGHPDSNSPSPSASSQELISKVIPPSWSSKGSVIRKESGPKVAAHKAFYEDLTSRSSTNSIRKMQQSPEKKRHDESTISNHSSRISVSVISPDSTGNRTPSGDRTPSNKRASDNFGRDSPSVKRSSLLIGGFEGSSPITTEMGKEKSFDGINLPLPPLQTSVVRLREVQARRNPQGGGFGFILRKSYLPMPDEPDKTKLVHLIEPRADYLGPLMTGDRIIEVNGEVVEDSPHEIVVELIKASGDFVGLQVASMPELFELNARGALDDTFSRNSGLRKSGKAKQGTG